MPLKAKRLAIRQSLSLAASENRIVIIEDIKLKAGKTSEITALLSKLSLKGRILMVNDTKTDDLLRSTANIQKLKLVKSNYLNTYDVINADYLLITTAGLKGITEWLGEAK